jgi:hypothetical protein
MKRQIESPHTTTVFRMCTVLMHQFLEVPTSEFSTELRRSVAGNIECLL